MNLLTKQKQTQSRERTFMVEGWGVRIVREFGMDMYTRLYLKWITNKDLLQSTGNSAQCYVEARMAGEFGGECTHVCVWLFLCYSPETITSLLLYYAAAAAKSLQSCPTLCDPRDDSPPGSPIPGILQARTLEWVAISFSIPYYTPIQN